MKSPPVPATAAIRFLKEHCVSFTLRHYAYVDHGGTSRAAEELHINEHEIIKTLVFQDEAQNPFLMLMHGDQEVSLKELARALGVKTVTPSNPQTAERHTGCQVGGISPFATRKRLPVYAEQTIFDLPHILINAGKRGVLAEIAPASLRALLPVTEVRAARGRCPLNPRRGE